MKTESSGTVSGRVDKIIREKVGEYDKVTVIIDATNETAKHDNLVSVAGFNKAAPLLDPLVEGDVVRISVWLNGRLYNGKYYTNIDAYKVEILDAQPRESAPAPAPAKPAAVRKEIFTYDDEPAADPHAADMALPADDSGMPF
jgi:single-strand DNA-binding protein